MNERKMVGVIPWLPWPLSAGSWWTEPIQAERLALLRIGVALCLLADITLNYAPLTFTFFSKAGLGDPIIFNWRFETDRMTWSLLRGVGDGAIVFLSLTSWIATTCWILAITFARLVLLRKNPPVDDRTGIALFVWSFALLVYVTGSWSRLLVAAPVDFLAWLVPLVGFSLACLFIAIDLTARWREPTHRIVWLPLLFALLTSVVLIIAGLVFAQANGTDKTMWWARPLGSWQEDDTLLVASMCLWIASAGLLLVGCATRFAAVLAWTISMSFANINSYLDNAGDTIRLILLFYLMLCPCGAVWSVDAWFTKRSGPVYVHPWPIRLIFVQMILMYFLNGLYKLLGPDWQEGSSLHYVLGDLTLTRFSQMTLALPLETTRVLTWSVVAWEVTFPLFVLWKWPRRITLTFGVLFHLGIFATMELAGFVPYALCMYLPLVPWERQGTNTRKEHVISADT